MDKNLRDTSGNLGISDPILSVIKNTKITQILPKSKKR